MQAGRKRPASKRINMNYELHPLCTLFPRLDGNEFNALKEDIKQNGLRQPIVLKDGMILDGGNRYRACVEAGIEPKFVEFDGDNIVSFVLSVNLHRRHMTPGQQAAIVASAQDWSKANSHGGDRKSDQSKAIDFDTVEKRAAASGVSRITQMKADSVAKADPELAKQVAHGEISLPKAVEKISPRKTKEEIPEEIDDCSDDRDQIILELKDAVVMLDEENTRLKDALAANQLPEDEIQSASEIIADLRALVKSLEAELDAVKSSRDSYMVENGELKKQLVSQRNQLKKLGAQIG